MQIELLDIKGFGLQELQDVQKPVLGGTPLSDNPRIIRGMIREGRNQEEVMLIPLIFPEEQVGQLYNKASALSHRQMEDVPENDDYWKHRIGAAKRLVAIGLSDALYEGAGTGHTTWTLDTWEVPGRGKRSRAVVVKYSKRTKNYIAELRW